MKDNSSFPSVSLIQDTPENGLKFDEFYAKVKERRSENRSLIFQKSLAACSQEHVVEKIDKKDAHIV